MRSSMVTLGCVVASVGFFACLMCATPEKVVSPIPPEALIPDDPSQVGNEIVGDTDVRLPLPGNDGDIVAVMFDATSDRGKPSPDGSSTFKFSTKPADSQGHLASSHKNSVEEETIEEIRRARETESYLGDIDRALVSIDPKESHSFEIRSAGLKSLGIEIHRVSIPDWPRWAVWRRPFWVPHDQRGPLPGTKIFSGDIAVKNASAVKSVTAVDFSPFLEHAHGQFILFVKARTEKDKILFGAAWVQFTSLGLTTVENRQRLRVFVSRQEDGKPVKEAAVSLEPGSGVSGITADDGFVDLKLPWGPASKALLIACRTDDDLLLFPKETEPGSWSPGFKAVAVQDEIAWHVIKDKPQYRPLETIYFKGRLRTIHTKGAPIIAALSPLPKQVAWSAIQDKKTIGQGYAAVNEHGGFDFSFAAANVEEPNIPTFVSVVLKAEGLKDRDGAEAEYRESIPINPVAEPKFAVSIGLERSQPYIAGELIRAFAFVRDQDAKGVRGADVTWVTRARPIAFSPPNRTDYSFGPISSFKERDDFTRYERPLPSLGGPIGSLMEVTDERGAATLGLRFSQPQPFRPVEVTLRASSTAPAPEGLEIPQEIEAVQKWVLHPAALYVGLRTGRLLFKDAGPVKVEALTVNVDGNAVVGVPMTIRLSKIESERNGCDVEEAKSDVEECRIVSQSTASICSFHPKRSGEYQIEARIKDRAGRENRTEIRIWVQRGESAASSDDLKSRFGTLALLHKEAFEDKTMSLVVRSPFYPAEGLLTVTSEDDLVHIARISLRSPVEEFFFKVPKTSFPDMKARVDLVGSSKTCTSPDYFCDFKTGGVAASADTVFSVRSQKKELEIAIVEKSQMDVAKDESLFEITVSDGEGSKVKDVEVTVFVQEEGPVEHALDGMPTTSMPPSEFLQSRTGIISDMEALKTRLKSPVHYLHSNDFVRHPILDTKDRSYLSAECYPFVHSDGQERWFEPPKGRTVAYIPSIITDAQGKASVRIRLPQPDLSYRLIAVASDKDSSFGVETKVLIKKEEE